jgi:hydrogenase-4 component E
MAVTFDLVVQGAQMLLVLLLAPLLTGFVRKVKARLLRRQGPPLIQPYRDLVRLMRKEVVLADNASWLFRVIPYLVFAATWVAASLVPTFRTGLLFSWSADLIAIIALLGSARFFLALAGLDVGTSFGGIGSSREVMIASLAEPAMIMIVFTVALIAGSTQLSTMAGFLVSSEVGLRVSLGLALVALVMVAIAENARIPVDNPATHLELTMVHGHGAGIFRSPLGADRAFRFVAAPALHVPDRLPVRALGSGAVGRCIRSAGDRGHRLHCQARARRLPARGFRDIDRQDARIPSAGIPRRCVDARPVGDASAVRFAEPLMHGLTFDIAHLLAGSLVLVSFLELYQDRLYALLNLFALHAFVLALSVAWQAHIQDAPHLYLTAAIALVFKAIIIPVALQRIIVRLGIHREIEKVVGVGPAMLLGMGLVALSMVVMLRVTPEADPLAREDLAFALAVVLLGLLMMVTRRNAVSQVVGFMSLENGLVLAATGAKGMPLVVEISVAFSILIAFIVIGIFLFRIRERFDTVDVQALDRFRGERG